MNIEKSRILKECIDQMSVLKEKYINDMNTINYYYWPIMAKEKKKVKSANYFFIISVCSLAFGLTAVFLGVIEGDYGKLVLSIVLALLVILFGFIALRTKKKYKSKDQIWKNNLARLKPEKDKIDNLEIIICTDIIKIIAQKEFNVTEDDIDFNLFFERKKNELISSVGSSTEELIPYYYTWLDKLN